MAAPTPKTELESVLNALRHPAAVITAGGKVVAVNRAWAESKAPAAALGVRLEPGADLAAVLRAGGTTAPGIAEAVERVGAGTVEHTTVSFPGNGKEEGGGVEVELARLELSGKPHVLVTCSRQNEACSHAQAVDAVKSAFVASISHELRTPMTGIIGMTDLALETQVTEEQREYLVAVRSSAHSLLTLVNDLLDFSRLEAGRLRLESIPFSLRNSLGEIVKTFAGAAQTKGLELVYDVAPDVPDDLLGDPGRLRQIVMHLVDNGIKFTDVGGVTLRVRREEDPADQVHLRFEVIDTGVGIDPALHQRIFESFTQGEEGSTRGHNGTGLGLAIARELVQAMGGRIGVESCPGQGSRFQFDAVFRPSAAPVEEHALTPHAKLRGLRALIADDNPLNRRAIGQSLEALGIRAEASPDGMTALDAIRKARAAEDPYGVVILDVHMPGLDGFAVAQAIQSEPELKATPVILMTLAGQRGDAARCRELGVAGYLTKPFSPKHLTATVQAVLGEPRDPAIPRLVTRHSLREGRAPMRVLLAVADEATRRVAGTLLESQGHEVDVVGSGTDAVELADRELFDLILMDVRLPDLDGVQATGKIRAAEKGGGRYVPIIALAEHVTEADIGRFLAAGMNGHVTKPLRVADLMVTLERMNRTGTGAGRSAYVERVVDDRRLLEQVGGDPDLLEEIVSMYREQRPRILRGLAEAIDHGTAAEVERESTKLRGTFGSLAAQPALETIDRLERMGRAGNLREARKALEALDAMTRTISRDLSAVLARTQGAARCES